MIAFLIIGFVVAAALAVAVTPAVMRLAFLLNAIDMPNGRKIHQSPMPRFGGVAVALSAAVTLIVIFAQRSGKGLLGFMPADSLMQFPVALSIALACAGVLAIGMWDDIKSIGPLWKFVGEVALGTIVYLAGVRIDTIANPLGGGMVSLGWMSYPATIFWIVGITNALNLMDGLDGLASGIALQGALTIALIAFVRNNIPLAMIGVVVAGAVTGFLKYNAHPAKIFLGDSGSLFLGFTLSVLAMAESTKGSTAYAIVVPMLALGLPIADTSLAIVRRSLRAIFSHEAGKKFSFSSLRQVVQPDREHIHHRLLALGLSHKRAVHILYAVSLTFGAAGLVLSVVDGMKAAFVLLAMTCLAILGVRTLRYRDISLFKRGVFLPLFHSKIFRSMTFKLAVDGTFIAASSTAAFLLLQTVAGEHFVVETLPLGAIVAMQLIAFLAAGIYRNTMYQVGVADTMKIAWSVFSAIALVAFVQLAIGHDVRSVLVLGVLDYYFLMTLVRGSRFAYSTLKHYHAEDAEGKGRVLIYGADAGGLFALQCILNDASLNLSPVAFIDEDPRLEGKRMQGLPVLGGHWKLHRYLRDLDIKEIILAGRSIKPEVLQRVTRIARDAKVPLRSLSISFGADAAPAQAAQDVVFSAPAKPEPELVAVHQITRQ